MPRPAAAAAAPLALLPLLLCAVPALAKPWQGVEPGVTPREVLLQKFGPPSKVVMQEGLEVVAYFGKEAIAGTTQTQFKVDPVTKKVERIDVFPARVVDRDVVEQNYGPACPAGPAPATPCFQKRLTDDFRTYYLYPRLGLAVFFSDDGKTVQSLTYTPLAQAR